jgi:Ca2+-binding RTX toxin-like protein
MATIHIDRDGFQTYTISQGGNTYILDRDVSLVVQSNPMVVLGAAAGTRLELNGQLIAGDLTSALTLSSNDSTVTIGRYGALMGNFGTTISGDNIAITNHGLVDGFNYGMQFSSLNADIVSDGTILGNVYGIIIGEQSARESSAIDNDGLIEGQTAIYTNAAHGTFRLGEDSRIIGETIAIRAISTVGGTTEVLNEGFIKTLDTTAYEGGGGVDTFINRGMIRGDVLLGGGNDFYDDRDGRTIGEVLGGAGSDTYMVSSYKTRVFEQESDEGTDTVRSNVTYLLEGHGEIETLILTGREKISGFGNTYDNRIVGNGADNKIDGGDGSDVLVGGAGRDTFIFEADRSADVIVDFENGKDLIRIVGSDAADFDDLELTRAGDNVEVRVFLGELFDTIVIENTRLRQIDAGDFMFT